MNNIGSFRWYKLLFPFAIILAVIFLLPIAVIWKDEHR